MFSRLEGRIKVESNALIDDKHATLTNWSHRRVWEILYSRKRNLYFLDRVGLLVPLSGPDYALIKAYYDQRNSIAHGGTFTIVLSLPTVIADMKRLYGAVRR